eukprot:4604804-Karenia_brevis.AAC.1
MENMRQPGSTRMALSQDCLNSNMVESLTFVLCTQKTVNIPPLPPCWHSTTGKAKHTSFQSLHRLIWPTTHFWPSLKRA